MAAVLEEKERFGRVAAVPDQEVREGAAERAQDSLSLILIDHRALTRRCLGDWFEEHRLDFCVTTFPSPAIALQRPDCLKGSDLVVLSIGAARVTDADVSSEIERLIHDLGEVALVLLADREEVGEIVEALGRGVRGYIPTSLDLTEAAEALRFVRAGGTFVPASALIRAAQKREPVQDRAARSVEKASFQRLTRRELDVLARLREGKPNKIIAHELAISEGTVKVFVRRILIKLQAINRTEVAYLAHRALDTV
ncbi:MAG: LuxR C-terminal-related transcriptional regulator [Geminicoccaceae bacterium]